MLQYDLINEAGERLAPHRRPGRLRKGDLLFPAGAGGRNVLVLKVLAPLRDRTAGQLLVRDVIEPG
jgi:hypothetical protein